MTENLLQKLEEKMMLILTEVEDLREELARLHHENTSLKGEKENNAKRLQDLILLLDTVNASDNLIAKSSMKPVLVQDKILG